MAASDVPRAPDGRVLPDAGHTRPCHYTLLGLDFTCDAAAVKKAFRKTALKWHPDKNRSEHASDYFKFLQEAYETLSDPQERAWYDAHRETILRGRNPGEESDDDGEARLVNVFEYFSVSCFDGFGDSEGGFFAVFSGVFAGIYKEELRFSEALNAARAAGTASAADIPPAAPAFGKSETDPTEVMGFYNHWAIFSSGMTFMWEDKYHTADAPDRWVKRKMEAENKRLRKAARQKRGEEVRQLVAWVRKRDPRMRAALAAAAAAEEARLAEIAAKQAAQKAKRAQRIQRQLQEMEEAYEEQEDYEAEREMFSLAEEDGDDGRRRRKKKGKKKASKSAGGSGGQDDEAASQSSDHSDLDAAGGAGAAGAGDAIEGGDATSDEEGGVDDVLLGLIGGSAPSEDVRGRRKGGKKAKKPQAAATAAGGGEDTPPTPLGRSKKKKGKKNKKRGMVMDDPTGGVAALDSDEDAPSGVPGLGVPLPPGQLDDSDSDSGVAPPAVPGAAAVASASGHSEPTKAEKRAARRAKRKAKAAAKEGGGATAGKAKGGGGGDAGTDCAVCGAEFGTRNKLFAHIKKTGHAVLK